MSTSNYPLSSRTSLLHQYLGTHLTSPTVPTPTLVLDLALVKRNCNAMLTATAALGVGFRAHVKSHKTLQLSKLQVGADIDRPAAFVVSTLIEAENLLPYLLECEAGGRKCSLIYGVPIPLSSVPRLGRLAQKLKPGTIDVLIDNQSAFLALKEQLKTQNEALHTLGEDALSIGVYIKVDTGYHRAGIQTSSPKFKELVETVVAGCGKNFRGFYSHFGHSYAGSSEQDAANGLLEELKGLEEATRAVPDPANTLTLTVGATPTATAAQNMLASNAIPAVAEFKRVIQRLQENHKVEFHAGVYPLLDLQQVATQARPSTSDPRSGFEPLATSSIAIKMLVEVTSIYDEREKPEALVSAGSLALGREPCKSYPGWGIVTGDLGNARSDKIYDAQGNKTGWVVGRVSQEHGILTWEGPKEEMTPLKVGDRLLIWPNHACVAGAGFGWYAIIDSEREATEIVDIWVRWRGW